MKNDEKLFPQIAEIKTSLLELLSFNVCDVVRGKATGGEKISWFYFQKTFAVDAREKVQLIAHSIDELY